MESADRKLGIASRAELGRLITDASDASSLRKGKHPM
jgi:hypothetical protein